MTQLPCNSRRSKPGLAVAICSGAALLLGVTAWLWLDSGVQPRESYSQIPINDPQPVETARSDGSNSTAMAASSPDQRPSRVEVQHTCTIVNEEGSPIVTARLLALATKDRAVPESSVRPMAMADSGGVLVLPADWRSPIPGKRVVLYAPGYRMLEQSEITGREFPARIVMKQATHLTIRCVDQNGHPVRDACAAITRTSLSSEAVLQALSNERLIPGPIADSAIHLGRADSNGIIFVDGFQALVYSAGVWSESMVRETTGDPLDLTSSQEIVVRFCSFWCVGVEVPSDRVLAHRFSRKPDLRGMVADRNLEKQKEALERQWPNAVFELGVQWDDSSPDVSYQLLAEMSGFLSGTLRPVPLSAFTGPVSLTAPGQASVAKPTRLIRFRLRDRADVSWPIDIATQLTIGSPAGGTLPLPLDASGQARVPHGTVALQVRNPFLQGLVAPPLIAIDESTPDQVEFAVDAQLRECRIEVSSTEGWEVSNGVMTLAIGGKSMTLFAGNLRNMKLLLPIGRGKVSFSAHNIAAKSIPFTVEAAPDASPQTIRIEIQTAAH